MPRTNARGRGRDRGREQIFEAESEDKILASRLTCLGGLNITGAKLVFIRMLMRLVQYRLPSLARQPSRRVLQTRSQRCVRRSFQLERSLPRRTIFHYVIELDQCRSRDLTSIPSEWSGLWIVYQMLLSTFDWLTKLDTAIKHPGPDRVKPSFVIFDIRVLLRSALSVRVPGSQKLQMTA